MTPHLSADQTPPTPTQWENNGCGDLEIGGGVELKNLIARQGGGGISCKKKVNCYISSMRREVWKYLFDLIGSETWVVGAGINRQEKCNRKKF